VPSGNPSRSAISSPQSGVAMAGVVTGGRVILLDTGRSVQL
jgi:hypothetical protein